MKIDSQEYTRDQENLTKGEEQTARNHIGQVELNGLNPGRNHLGQLENQWIKSGEKSFKSANNSLTKT